MAKPSTSARRITRRPAGRAVVPDTLTQVRALSHPLRLRLLELFAQRPRTTMQAAGVLGESATRLYHHVAALERAGLVRLRETRPNRGTTEKYFEAVTTTLRPGSGAALLADESGRRGLSAAAVLLFDQARNELVRALAAAGERPPATMMAVRAVLRLSPARGERLVRELSRLMRRQAGRRGRGKADPDGASQRDDRRPYSLTVALLPIEANSEASRAPGRGRARVRKSAAKTPAGRVRRP